MDSGADDRRLDARLYDAVHRGNAGDVRFYRDACAGADPILELGCGSGRILVPLARDGHDVTGIDRHQGRLERCRRRAERAGVRPRLVLGDLAGFDLAGSRFERVLAPYHVLAALVDDADLAGCLRSARAHLAPHGRFVFDGYPIDPSSFPDPDARPGPPEPLVTFQEGDETVRVFERDVVRPGRGRIDAEYTFHLHRPGVGVRVRRQVVRHRLRTIDEWVDVVRSAGFRVRDRPVVHRPRGGGTWFSVVAEPEPSARG